MIDNETPYRAGRACQKVTNSSKCGAIAEMASPTIAIGLSR